MFQKYSLVVTMSRLGEVHFDSHTVYIIPEWSATSDWITSTRSHTHRSITCILAGVFRASLTVSAALCRWTSVTTHISPLINVIGPNQSAHSFVLNVPQLSVSRFQSPVCLSVCLYLPLVSRSVSDIVRLRVTFGMVHHEDTKQTQYTLNIVRVHFLDFLSLYQSKGWQV